jgi:hypothetical protein
LTLAASESFRDLFIGVRVAEKWRALRVLM